MTVPTPGPRPGDPRPPGPRPVADLRTDVEDALAGLDELADRPVAEHPVAFERVHAALGRALTAGSERD
ncbi:hypothetical protein [Pseudonocardia sp. HH130630-07]|uniref:hypothetical protein n=1 Tax=Pseudonocardia sp. HH130630-07 TaxID=1690815 RepID=UPI000814D3CB|nr:hypothetical protein [Pseudonocardia sp. HH130630-07]ANY08797.1 hypothetical protein AFB00_23850 [Pseudonocardia sp. HH130630-07]